MLVMFASVMLCAAMLMFMLVLFVSVTMLSQCECQFCLFLLCYVYVDVNVMLILCVWGSWDQNLQTGSWYQNSTLKPDPGKRPLKHELDGLPGSKMSPTQGKPESPRRALAFSPQQHMTEPKDAGPRVSSTLIPDCSRCIHICMYKLKTHTYASIYVCICIYIAEGNLE